MGTDTGDDGSSRCFSTGSGVGESSAETCLYPPCFSCAGTGGGGDGAGAEAGGSVELRESMPLRRSFEKSDGRFVGGAGALERGEPSGMLVGGSDSGDDAADVGGDEAAVAARLSATSVSRTAVGVPGAFSTENFSCRYRASVSSLCGPIEHQIGLSHVQGWTHRSFASGVGSSILVYSSESLWLIAAKTSDITYCATESVSNMRGSD
jgi:hypothetical protein